MGLNELSIKVARLEQQMENLERQILGELQDRKETQKAMQADLSDIKKKIWTAIGFLLALQAGLQIGLSFLPKH